MRDKDGNVISSEQTIEYANGEKTVKTTDEKGETTEVRYDKDGNPIATITYGDIEDEDGGFWDPDLIYGTPDGNGDIKMNQDFLSSSDQIHLGKHEQEMLVETFGEEMTEAFVDAFDFFM